MRYTSHRHSPAAFLVDASQYSIAQGFTFPSLRHRLSSMGGLVQMIGKTFGRLTVTANAPEYIDGAGRKRLRYICLCACGSNHEALGENLRSGHTTSCGCQQDDNRRKRAKDATGLRFGRLVVIGEAEKYVSPQGKTNRRVHARCDCGGEIATSLQSLKSGATTSCGCFRLEVTVDRNHVHGDAPRKRQTREYKTWSNMIARCENPNVERYPYYGGRGIRVCDRWCDSFPAFLEDMGRKPSPKHSIDRKDVNGNYEPDNCRWATPVEQANNKCNSRAA